MNNEQLPLTSYLYDVCRFGGCGCKSKGCRLGHWNTGILILGRYWGYTGRETVLGGTIILDTISRYKIIPNIPEIMPVSKYPHVLNVPICLYCPSIWSYEPMAIIRGDYTVIIVCVLRFVGYR